MMMSFVVEFKLEDLVKSKSQTKQEPFWRQPTSVATFGTINLTTNNDNTKHDAYLLL